MCFLDTLRKLELCGIWKFDSTGNILEFQDENAVIDAIHKMGKRKITIASFKRNMTMFGFSIVERGKLNYQNAEYTRENRERNIPIIRDRVKAKNKIDNDNKKRKNDEKEKLEAQPSEKVIKQETTESIIKALPVSNVSSPLTSFIIIPTLDVKTGNSTSISRSPEIIIKNESKEEAKLVIDESTVCSIKEEDDIETISDGSPDVNIEDFNDQLEDSTDQAGTLENSIDQELPINIISNSSGHNSPQNLELNKQAYKLGLQHKQNEFQSILHSQKRDHEKEIARLYEERLKLEQALIKQIKENQELRRNTEEAYSMAQNAVFQHLHAVMYNLNPIAHQQTFQAVSSTNKKSVVNNFKKSVLKFS